VGTNHGSFTVFPRSKTGCAQHTSMLAEKAITRSKRNLPILTRTNVTSAKIAEKRSNVVGEYEAYKLFPGEMRQHPIIPPPAVQKAVLAAAFAVLPVELAAGWGASFR